MQRVARATKRLRRLLRDWKGSQQGLDEMLLFIVERGRKQVHRELAAIVSGKDLPTEMRVDAAATLVALAAPCVAWRVLQEAHAVKAMTSCLRDSSTPNELVEQGLEFLRDMVRVRSCQSVVVALTDDQDVLEIAITFVSSPELAQARLAANLLSQLTRRHLSSSTFERLAPSLPMLADLIRSSEDPKLLASVCWVLNNVADGPDSSIAAVQDVGVTPRLVELFAHRDTDVMNPAMRTLGEFVRGTDAQTQIVLDAGALVPLKHVLQTCKRSIILKDACWMTSNITAGTVEQIKAVLDAGLLHVLVARYAKAPSTVRKEMIWALANAVLGGAPDQVELLSHSRFCRPIIRSLREIDNPRMPWLPALESLSAMCELYQQRSPQDLATFVAMLRRKGAVRSLTIHAERALVHVRTTSVARTILATFFGFEPDTWGEPLSVPMDWDEFTGGRVVFDTLAAAVAFWQDLAGTEADDDQIDLEACVSSDNVRGVLHFLSKLRSAQEFDNGESERHGLALRVVEALHTLCNDEYAREEIIARMLESLDACGDKPIWALNQLHLMSLTAHARGDRAALRKLGLRVLRLDIVHTHAARIVRETYKGNIDDVCVYLGLELALRDKLDLPVSAKAMIFSTYVEIPQSELDLISGEALAVTDQALEAWLDTWPEWQRQLRQEAADALTWSQLPRNSRRFSTSFINLFGDPISDPVRIGKQGTIWSMQELLKHWVATGVDLNNTPRSVSEINTITRTARDSAAASLPLSAVDEDDDEAGRAAAAATAAAAAATMDPGVSAEAQQQIAQLQQQLGGKEITQENMQQLEMRKRQEQEMKEEMLTRICTPEALDRLKRVGIVKPDVSTTVQNSLLNAARSGQLQSRVDEDQVKGMLEQVGQQKAAASRVKIQRKTYFDEDDSDDNDDDLL
ncbi:Importin subunit alpha-6 (Karyopherin subunit alpha-5) [Durusdinium trenchii]|uniref:Importin subunit alpha-6 (Karyopherin subunit alpha-5) n=1 Tax=Durusdinium trenchii TaxID=1381693 RepID=A0ABP0SI28_9DINO